MTENNLTPSKQNEPSPSPNRREILRVAGLASFIIYLLVGILMLVFSGATFGEVFYFGCVTLFVTLPFTFLTVLIYRKVKLPSRFALPVAVLIGVASLICVSGILYAS